MALLPLVGLLCSITLLLAVEKDNKTLGLSVFQVYIGD